MNIFRSHNLLLKTKIYLLRSYVFTVLLYEVGFWTLTEASMNKLQVFEMWCYRRILRIIWEGRFTNNEILRKNDKQCEIVITLKQSKIEYLGYYNAEIMKARESTNRPSLLQGKVYGKRGSGRRISRLQNLQKWFSLNTITLFRAVANKVKIALLVANVRNE